MATNTPEHGGFDVTAGAPMMARPPALMFGVPITDLTMTEALHLIAELVRRGRELQTAHQVVTVNVDFLVNALTEPDTKRILQRADVALADGAPVTWAARLLGMPIAERVAGVDLVPALIEASRTTGHHVHIFGSLPDVADRARELLHRRYPGALFSIDPGPMIPDSTAVDDAILRSIEAVDADILCVALGNPKQERFIAAHRARLRTPVMIGIGGSLDMLVGRRRRAPLWAQRAGLEWLVRVIQEPRRLGRRYARDVTVFGPHLVHEYRNVRRRRATSGLQVDIGGDDVIVRFTGDHVLAPGAWSDVAARLPGCHRLSITAETSSSVRDVAVAQLCGFVSVARWAGVEVGWTPPSWDPMPIMAALGVDGWSVGGPE